MRQLIRVQVPAWAPTTHSDDRRSTAVVLSGSCTCGVGCVARAVSSAGQSASLTPRMSGVRVPHRPPPFLRRPGTPASVLRSGNTDGRRWYPGRYGRQGPSRGRATAVTMPRRLASIHRTSAEPATGLIHPSSAGRSSWRRHVSRAPSRSAPTRRWPHGRFALTLGLTGAVAPSRRASRSGRASTRTTVLRVSIYASAKFCGPNQSYRLWNTTGPKGATGATGAQGLRAHGRDRRPGHCEATLLDWHHRARP